MLSKSSKYILLVLLIHKEKLVTSEYLIGKIWGDTTLERNVRIKILRLKKYLELLEISHWIVTIR
jgi:DNA-binding response OmpR family regulator